MANSNQKKIDAQNKKILENHFYAILIANGLYFLLRIVWGWSTFGFFPICGFLLLSIGYYAVYRFLKSFAEPIITEDSYVVQDLTKLKGTFAEYWKIRLTIVGSILSNWFWLVYLVLPGFLVWKGFGYLMMYLQATSQGGQNTEQELTPEQIKKMEKNQRKQDLADKRMMKFK